MTGIFALVAALFTGAIASSPDTTQDRPNTSAGSIIVSPAVIASWMAHPGTTGTSTLDLLVLWRGTPGWFMKGGPTREHSAGDSLGRTTMRLSRGGIDLELRFDPRNRSAQINGQAIDLRDANVILVDHVDTEQKIVGTGSVEPQLSGSPGRIQQVLKRSKNLISFLRCDVRLEDPKIQELMNQVCAQLSEAGK